MGAVRRSRALCARPDSGGQALLGVSQPQTTGDGRLFQRKIVGAATMPSRGRGGAPSWPEVRDESLCPGGASPPDIGRKAYCPGKRRPVLRCHDWGRRCRRRGVWCRNGRKEGWKEEWGGGCGRFCARRRCGATGVGREGGAGMEGRCRKLEMPQAPEDFYKDKNKKRHNRGCGIS